MLLGEVQETGGTHVECDRLAQVNCKPHLACFTLGGFFNGVISDIPHTLRDRLRTIEEPSDMIDQLKVGHYSQ